MEYLEPWFGLEANAEFFQRELVAEIGSVESIEDWIEQGMKADHEFSEEA